MHREDPAKRRASPSSVVPSARGGQGRRTPGRGGREGETVSSDRCELRDTRTESARSLRDLDKERQADVRTDEQMLQQHRQFLLQQKRSNSRALDQAQRAASSRQNDLKRIHQRLEKVSVAKDRVQSKLAKEQELFEETEYRLQQEQLVKHDELEEHMTAVAEYRSKLEEAEQALRHLQDGSVRDVRLSQASLPAEQRTNGAQPRDGIERRLGSPPKALAKGLNSPKASPGTKVREALATSGAAEASALPCSVTTAARLRSGGSAAVPPAPPPPWAFQVLGAAPRAPGSHVFGIARPSSVPQLFYGGRVHPGRYGDTSDRSGANPAHQMILSSGVPSAFAYGATVRGTFPGEKQILASPSSSPPSSPWLVGRTAAALGVPLIVSPSTPPPSLMLGTPGGLTGRGHNLVLPPRAASPTSTTRTTHGLEATVPQMPTTRWISNANPTVQVTNAATAMPVPVNLVTRWHSGLERLSPQFTTLFESKDAGQRAASPPSFFSPAPAQSILQQQFASPVFVPHSPQPLSRKPGTGPQLAGASPALRAAMCGPPVGVYPALSNYASTMDHGNGQSVR